MTVIEDCKYRFYFINIRENAVFVHRIVTGESFCCNLKTGVLHIENNGS